jgi:hypothetical protein
VIRVRRHGSAGERPLTVRPEPRFGHPVDPLRVRPVPLETVDERALESLPERVGVQFERPGETQRCDVLDRPGTVRRRVREDQFVDTTVRMCGVPERDAAADIVTDDVELLEPQLVDKVGDSSFLSADRAVERVASVTVSVADEIRDDGPELIC